MFSLVCDSVHKGRGLGHLGLVHSLLTRPQPPPPPPPPRPDHELLTCTPPDQHAAIFRSKNHFNRFTLFTNPVQSTREGNVFTGV